MAATVPVWAAILIAIIGGLFGAGGIATLYKVRVDRDLGYKAESTKGLSTISEAEARYRQDLTNRVEQLEEDRDQHDQREREQIRTHFLEQQLAAETIKRLTAEGKEKDALIESMGDSATMLYEERRNLRKEIEASREEIQMLRQEIQMLRDEAAKLRQQLNDMAGAANAASAGA